MTLSRALRIVVAVALTAYVLFKSHPADVARVAAGASASWLLLAVLLVVLDRAVNAYRWVVLLRALTPGSRPRLSAVMHIFFVSSFVGNFLPSIGGDVYRAYQLARLGVRSGEAAASVLMDRIVGVLSMVIVATVALYFLRELELPGVMPALLLVTVVCAVAAAVVFSSRAAEIVNRSAGQLPWSRLHRIASSLTDAVRRYASHHGELMRVLVASVAVQALRVLQAFCLGRAIGIDLPIGVFFVFIPIAVLMMQLPITISGLGVAQGAFVWLFGRAGVPAAEATALSLLFIALGVLGNLPGAALYIGSPRLQR